MEREIKFRGMSIDGSWCYGCFVDNTTCFCRIVNGMSNSIVKLKTVGQFTGLYDKNGKEIYEGDILLHTGTNQCDLEVHFKEGAFCGKGIFTDCVMDMFLKAYDFHSIEVIGNIHEKPELL